ncbi:MoaD/ThiS family protein [Lysobacter solisilvae (ex Woo and Kim 2020)]|uniref:Molybdopterin synthase sulfur carrier subunit n=1 Tax=Agrilutibacter terrestris TaxID=2865112 RepID=A0A7H0FYB6_9GAMM|nr:MoaD/ThiS family protein [Lysobacter terrestris]QNP41032.1 MoaD/ThiS family protein [Lysobacter terrestris]
MKVTVLYFAALRDASGVASEIVESAAVDLRSLYGELQECHRLPFPARQLRVAVDGEFAHWDDAPRDGSEVAFIPPVSGG